MDTYNVYVVYEGSEQYDKFLFTRYQAQKNAIESVRNSADFQAVVSDVLYEDIVADTVNTFKSIKIEPIFDFNKDEEYIRFDGVIRSDTIKEIFGFDDVSLIQFSFDNVSVVFNDKKVNEEEESKINEWYTKTCDELTKKNSEWYHEMRSDDSIIGFIEAQEILFAEDGTLLLGDI